MEWNFLQLIYYCRGFNFQGLAYTNTSPVVSWQWYFGDGGTAVSQNTTTPIATAGTTGSITCTTNTINLTSTLAGMNYTWTAPGGSSISSGTNSQNSRNR